MGRSRRLSGKEVCEILGRHGFQLVRQRGSHAVCQHRTADGTTTVPDPMHDNLTLGTLSAIIRQSGLPRSEFESE
ncbi:MAG: type II toxin-antitoxin system HicA family toxin [Methanoregulaceae archaeon]|nr:type II toxin-antitoxin system HicA family toxin [Methanoregulaceae archaeon]